MTWTHVAQKFVERLAQTTTQSNEYIIIFSFLNSKKQTECWLSFVIVEEPNYRREKESIICYCKPKMRMKQ